MLYLLLLPLLFALGNRGLPEGRGGVFIPLVLPLAPAKLVLDCDLA